jgi:hypothetical protein
VGSICKHQNLAVLRVLEDKFMNYVKSVMEASVDRSDIYMYEMPMCKKCRCKTQKDRYPRTKKQGIYLINSFNMDTHPLIGDSLYEFKDPKGAQELCEVVV